VKSNKDISDLIRENAHKLEQRPSKNAWERLENKLDQKEIKPRFSIRRILSIAAAVVGLVGFGAIISFSFLQPTAKEKGFYEVVEFQHKYQARLSKPIIEGPGKKITLSKRR